MLPQTWRCQNTIIGRCNCCFFQTRLQLWPARRCSPEIKAGVWITFSKPLPQPLTRENRSYFRAATTEIADEVSFESELQERLLSTPTTLDVFIRNNCICNTRHQLQKRWKCKMQMLRRCKKRNLPRESAASVSASCVTRRVTKRFYCRFTGRWHRQ